MQALQLVCPVSSWYVVLSQSLHPVSAVPTLSAYLPATHRSHSSSFSGALALVTVAPSTTCELGVYLPAGQFSQISSPRAVPRLPYGHALHSRFSVVS